MKRLYVLYDGRCSFCCGCAQWLTEQRQQVPLELLARQSPEAAARFAVPLRQTGQDDLLVIAENGDVYRNESAYLICLWALKEYRGWAKRLARPWLRPAVRQFFKMTSRSRGTLSAWWSRSDDDSLRARLSCEAVSCETTLQVNESSRTNVLRELLDHP